MIQLVRVDGRLIHGMVAVTWCGMYRPDIMVVVNDEAANNEFHTMTLKLAKPAGVDKCFVWTKEKAIERLNSDKYNNKKLFITVATVEDAYYLAKNCPSVKNVNIGPEVDGTDGRVTTGKVEISDGVYINEAKYNLLKELNDNGVEVFAQVTTAMPKVEWKDIATKFN
jgi:fructoselysine/glucoselysine PTS system EIIB component